MIDFALSIIALTVVGSIAGLAGGFLACIVFLPPFWTIQFIWRLVAFDRSWLKDTSLPDTFRTRLSIVWTEMHWNPFG